MRDQQTERSGERASGYRKAILYAAGGLAELYPLTSVVPKALLPVYDKPLVYYPLSVLMLAGLRRIALVTSSPDAAAFERLLGDGRQLGIEIEYLTQVESAGPAQSFVTARDFIAAEPVAMVLADCVVYGDGLQRVLTETMHSQVGAALFAHPVGDPRRHAIVELSADGRPLAIEERPAAPKSNLAITGIHFYDHDVAAVAERLNAAQPRGASLTDIHRHYLHQGRLAIRPFGRGFAWLDTSTHAALNAATNFIETIESTHGLKIACLEEIAYQKGFISAAQLVAEARQFNNAYGAYLMKLAASDRAARA